MDARLSPSNSSVVAEVGALHASRIRDLVRELTDVWREWSLSTKPPLSAALVLADRDDEATRVLRWLYGEPAVMAVQAEAPGEAGIRRRSIARLRAES